MTIILIQSRLHLLVFDKAAEDGCILTDRLAHELPILDILGSGLLQFVNLPLEFDMLLAVTHLESLKVSVHRMQEVLDLVTDGFY